MLQIFREVMLLHSHQMEIVFAMRFTTIIFIAFYCPVMANTYSLEVIAALLKCGEPLIWLCCMHSLLAIVVFARWPCLTIKNFYWEVYQLVQLLYSTWISTDGITNFSNVIRQTSSFQQDMLHCITIKTYCG